MKHLKVKKSAWYQNQARNDKAYDTMNSGLTSIDPDWPFLTSCHMSHVPFSFESGCCVALFNRVRSQTLGYISGGPNGFEASVQKWSGWFSELLRCSVWTINWPMGIVKTLKVLHLYLLDTELEYAVGGFVNYGNIVQFADQTSGFSLPPCRIHRCEQSGK